MTVLVSVGYGQPVKRQIKNARDIRDVISNVFQNRYYQSLRDVQSALSTLTKMEAVFVVLDEAWRAEDGIVKANEKAKACRVLDMDDSEYLAEVTRNIAAKDAALAKAIELVVYYGFAKHAG